MFDIQRKLCYHITLRNPLCESDKISLDVLKINNGLPFLVTDKYIELFDQFDMEDRWINSDFYKKYGEYWRNPRTPLFPMWLFSETQYTEEYIKKDYQYKYNFFYVNHITQEDYIHYWKQLSKCFRDSTKSIVLRADELNLLEDIIKHPCVKNNIARREWIDKWVII